jgi:hypothetical protein
VGAVLMTGMPLHVGCCNPGCTNLDEEAESLLRLHLCQGCMRARYCSHECQAQQQRVAHVVVRLSDRFNCPLLRF